MENDPFYGQYVFQEKLRNSSRTNFEQTSPRLRGSLSTTSHFFLRESAIIPAVPFEARSVNRVKDIGPPSWW